MDLPVEMIKRIVSYIKDFHQLLQLRLVSGRWKDVIEDWLSKRNSLAIMEVDFVIDNQYSTLNDRFFRSLQNERFVLIQLRHFSDFSNMGFIQTVIKLFRSVLHFAFRAPLTPQGVFCLNFMLKEWSNLSTLSLSTDCPIPHYHFPISSAINNLKNLIRLDLGAPFQMSGLGETLTRIHYLAVGFVESREQFLNMIIQIGPHCKHIWVENWCDHEVLYRVDIMEWIRANPTFFKSLTHFGWPGKIAGCGLKEIDRYFTSLTTWHVAKEYGDVYVLLSLLPRLRELRVLHLSNPFCPIIVSPDFIIESPSCVRTLELHEVYCSNDAAIDNWVDVFIYQLRLFFPHAERVILTSPHHRAIETLEQCAAGDQRFQVLQSKRSHAWVRT